MYFHNLCKQAKVRSFRELSHTRPHPTDTHI